jgi:biotin carboxyl carrier protein
MPTYEVSIEGKSRKIELTKTGEKSFTAKIGDKQAKVELLTEKLDFEKGFSIQINGKTYKIELPKIQQDKAFTVNVEEATFKAETRLSSRETKIPLATFEPTPLIPSKTVTPTNQIIKGAVTAPMTGKILKVKVKKGDAVKAGQTLCVLEAMKMENEIASSKAGTVREVYVSEGSSVNEGDPLLLVD